MLRRRRPVLRAAALAGAVPPCTTQGRGTSRGRISEYEQDEAIQGSQQAQARHGPATSCSCGGGMSEEAIAKLQELGSLHDSGVLTDEEFAAQKAKLLG